MVNDTLITIVGNLTGDPELRFSQAGAAVASFAVASTPRTFDRQSNEWKDGEALFLRCNVWRDVAENVAESLTKGTRVIVQGNLKQRTWQDKEGQNRVTYEVDVVEIGPSLWRARAVVTRQQKTPPQGQTWAAQGQPAQPASPAQRADIWAPHPTEPPF